MRHIPRGARVAGFVGATCDQPWRSLRLGHLPGMAIARRAAFANDQFDLGSTALLTVTAPGVAGFAHDPSQIVTDRPCPRTSEFRTLAQALATFPRERFDYVWLVAPPPVDSSLLRGMRIVWRDRTDLLLRLEPPLSVTPSPP